MPERPWQTTEVRSCCSMPAGWPRSAELNLRRRSALRGSPMGRRVKSRKRPRYCCSVGSIEDAAGQLRVQVGEAILPLAGATSSNFGDGKVRLFRLNDGSHEMGYVFSEVLDF